MIYAILALLLACCVFAIGPYLMGRLVGWITERIVARGPRKDDR